MSKKNLAKTAIEGGRANYNKYERHESHRKERAYVREYCGKAVVDDEYYDHVAIKKRRKVGKVFTDKLAAMYRWLRSHVGEPWNDVRSKVTKLYDSRTIAGQHILYDHLLSSVCDSSESHHNWKWFDFVVDDNGILQLNATNRWNRKSQYKSYRKDKYPGDWVSLSEKELYKWVGLRKVIDYGAVQYWTAEPTRVSWRRCSHNSNLYYYPRASCYYPNKNVLVKTKEFNRLTNEFVEKTHNERHCLSPGNAPYAQGKKFSREEMEFWNKLHPLRRQSVVYDKDAWKDKWR